MKLLALIIFFFALVVLKGCGGGSGNDESASQTQYIYAAWVIIGSDEAGNNRAFARVATSYLSPSGQPVCPQINIDGRFSQFSTFNVRSHFASGHAICECCMAIIANS